MADRTVRLPDGQLRIYDPSPGTNDAGRMYVLDVFGVEVSARKREVEDPPGSSLVVTYVHISGAPVVCEVSNGGEEAAAAADGRIAEPACVAGDDVAPAPAGDATARTSGAVTVAAVIDELVVGVVDPFSTAVVLTESEVDEPGEFVAMDVLLRRLMAGI